MLTAEQLEKLKGYRGNLTDEEGIFMCLTGKTIYKAKFELACENWDGYLYGVSNDLSEVNRVLNSFRGRPFVYLKNKDSIFYNVMRSTGEAIEKEALDKYGVRFTVSFNYDLHSDEEERAIARLAFRDAFPNCTTRQYWELVQAVDDHINNQKLPLLDIIREKVADCRVNGAYKMFSS